jgi:hypothetical protein
MMNRHERRKAKVYELKKVRANEISGIQCAWKGCQASMKPDPNGDLPPGWSALLLTRSYRAYAQPLLDIPPELCLRDAALCPEHTRQLDSLLVYLSRELAGPAAGSA